MKRLFLMLLLAPFLLKAQDSEPSPMSFEFGNQSSQVFNPNNYQQNAVVHGFQWSGTPLMDDSLRNNIRGTGNVHEGEFQTNDTLLLLYQPSDLNATGYIPAYYWAPFMQYEPTLPLNDNNFGDILRPEDSSNPVFGFKYRRGTILSNSSDVNYSRLILYKDSVASYGGNTVLKDIQPQPHFVSRAAKDVSGQTDMYFGRKWYLTANVRRLNPEIDNVINDDAVLSLKIRYWGQNVSGLMVFDSIPQQDEDSIYFANYHQNRGKYQKMYESLSDSMLVTNRIIPVTSENSAITFSSCFFTVSEIEKNHDFGEDPFEIDSIDIEVNYFGNLDVAIDWVRIETMRAHYLLTGVADSMNRNTLTSCVLTPDPTQDTLLISDEKRKKTYLYDIKRIVETSLDDVYSETNGFQDAQFFRFYFQDIESDKYYWWGPLRYANKLTNNMVITRDNYKHPKLYEYYTLCPERWVGLHFNNWDAAIAPPYIRHGWQEGNFSPARAMDIKNGFKGRETSINFPDSLNSDYETYLDPTININNDYDYFNRLFSVENNIQPIWEARLYGYYYNPNTNVKNLIYSDKNWWIYSLFYSAEITPWQNGTTIDSIFNWNTYRAKTAEEFRLQWHSSMIRGCKGFIYDGDHQTDVDRQKRELRLGIGDTSKFTSYPLLSREVGDDFINSEYDTWNLETDSTRFSYVDTTAQYAGIDRDRVYIGTRSIRSELVKLHTFLDLMSDEIMDLRPFASLSKGYRQWQNWDERYSATDVWNNYIEFDTTKLFTKKIWEPTTGNYAVVKESYDSSFFDLTLMRYSENDIDNNKFVLGIQNRRTDPLLYLNSEVPLNSMIFISAAEFDEFVQNGGELYKNDQYYSSDFWKDLWWKRLGCRQLSVPINFKADNNPNYFSGRYYEIKELGYDNSELNSKFWRQPDLYHMIDTVIKENEAFTANLLPGQGKMIGVEAKYLAQTPEMEDTTCVTCNGINENIEVEVRQYQDNCYHLIIKNTGDCDYTALQLLFENELTHKHMSYWVPDDRWSFQWNEDARRCSFEGDLHAGEEYVITTCVYEGRTNYFQLYAGFADANNTIQCENFIDSGSFDDCCSFLSPVTLESSDIDCDSTGGCAWKVMAEVNPDSTCYTSYGIRAVKEDGTTEDITEDIIGDGSIYAEFCYCGEEVKFEFYLKDENDSIACVKELVDSCNLCDKYTIKDGLPIDPRHPAQELYLYTHIDELQVAYPRTHTNALWFKTIELNEIGYMLDKIEIEEYDMSGNLLKINDVYINESSSTAYPADFQRALDSKYRIVFYDKDGNVLCSYEFERHWELLQDNDIFEPSAMAIPVGNFCEYGIDVEQNQTPVDPIDIYYVIVSDMEAPSVVLHYEFRDPKSASPFDFSTSYHLTDLVKPIDSTLKVEIHYYDANFQPVEVSELTSSCMQMRTMSFASPILSSVSTMPHPADDKFSVEYTLLQSAKVEFEIRNQYGTVLYYKNEGNQKSGVHYKGFDTSSFISGQYYLVIQAGSETKVIPFVVIH